MSSLIPPENRSASSSLSPTTMSPPVRAWTMLSMPSRSAVPGATISSALTSRGSCLASSSPSSSPDREAIQAILAGRKVRKRWFNGFRAGFLQFLARRLGEPPPGDRHRRQRPDDQNGDGGTEPPAVAEGAHGEQPGGAPDHPDDEQDGVGRGSDPGREELGAVDAQRRDADPSADEAGERRRPQPRSADDEEQGVGEACRREERDADPAAPEAIGG